MIHDLSFIMELSLLNRNIGSGLASTSGRFGGILYPYVIYLTKLDIGPISEYMFLIIKHSTMAT